MAFPPASLGGLVEVGVPFKVLSLRRLVAAARLCAGQGLGACDQRQDSGNGMLAALSSIGLSIYTLTTVPLACCTEDMALPHSPRRFPRVVPSLAPLLSGCHLCVTWQLLLFDITRRVGRGMALFRRTTAPLEILVSVVCARAVAFLATFGVQWPRFGGTLRVFEWFGSFAAVFRRCVSCFESPGLCGKHARVPRWYCNWQFCSEALSFWANCVLQRSGFAGVFRVLCQLRRSNPPL